MKFSWINKQGVKSDSGFVLQRTERFQYRYTEEEKNIKVSVEPGLVEEIYFGPENRWEPPHEELLINPTELDRITDNLNAALEFMGTKFSMVR